MTNIELLQKLEAGESILGFRWEGDQYIRELPGRMWILSHPRSGAKVVYFDSGDEERCFSLSFPALPHDDTGVFHIIEHCLVNGSRKFPIPEWNNIGPQNSFFTAFTSLDNTMYPVASYVEKSFQDLVRIYTDSVFSPVLLDSDIPLMQEGWHYEYDAGTDALRCSGIVYSEIKAAHDLPYYLSILARNRAAFPDSPYAHDIGGAPESVPQLTYEQFLAAYRRVFRPENCLCCVWGNANLYDVLSTVVPYFDGSPAEGRRETLSVRPALWNGEPLHLEYPVVKAGGKQDVLGFQWVCDPDRLQILQGQIAVRLLEPLLSSRLIEKGMCGQVSFTCESEPACPLLALTLMGTQGGELDTIREEILRTVEELLKRDPSGNALAAALTAAEFALREGLGQVPRGIQAALDVTGAFVHGTPLPEALRYADGLAAIREAGWPALAAFIRRALLENDRHSEFVLTASETLAQRRQEAEALRLRASRRRLDGAGLQKVVEDSRRLAEYHAQPVNQGTVAALPKTRVEDLPARVPGEELVARPSARGDVLYLNNTDGVVRLTLYFPVERFDDAFLNHLGVLALLFGKVGIVGHTAQETAAEIGACTGGIHAIPAWYAPPEGDVLFLEVSLAALPEQFASAQELLQELLQGGNYADAAAVRQILTAYRNGQVGAIPRPDERTAAYFSHGAAALQRCGGVGLEAYVGAVLADFDRRFPELAQGVAQAAETVLDLSRAAVAIACGEEQWPTVERQLRFASHLECPAQCTAPLLAPRELFRGAGNMQYIAQGARVPRLTGPLMALCDACERPLRQRVREIGGAYAVRLELTPERSLLLVSGRDPNLRSTLETFRQLWQAVKEIDDSTLAAAVVSASATFNGFGKAGIGGFALRRKLERAARWYWNGVCGPARQALWEDLINADPRQIRQAAEMLHQAAGEQLYCAWASAEKAVEDRTLFDVLHGL